MAHAIVRIELHGAVTEDQYVRLHTVMRAAGFVRTIEGGGSKVSLPTAMYYSNTYADAESARDAAWHAASGIAGSYSVIATCGPSAWRGLQPA